MNILIPDSWLRDYLEVDLSAQKIGELLSLHAFSVEKILPQEDGDFVYEIEITPNRGDSLSVLGIARELKAILPAKGYSVGWKFLENFSANLANSKNLAGSMNDSSKKEYLPLDVEIKIPGLVPKFSAVIMDKVQVKASPKIIRDRLEKSGIRAINSVVDATNYVMIDWGQPMHAFDYDKISGQKMIVRESEEGEKIVTLDGLERILPAGVIVIEDGLGRLIDLCGIMGAKNSEVDEFTKRVLLFAQIYDPVRIRKASMALGHRTDAALRFEKGIDFERVTPSLWYAAELLEKNASAVLASGLIDITEKEFTQKKVYACYDKISKIAGQDINPREARAILGGLGFGFESNIEPNLDSSEVDGKAKIQDIVLVPSWRTEDINIPEDLAEEVIRILGYYSLPNRLPAGEIPQKRENPLFYWENVAKDFLKYQGFFECFTPSMTLAELAGKEALPLKNPLNVDFSHLRKSLIPQLLEVIKENKGYSPVIKVFEIARVFNYTKENSKEGQLPSQPFMLGMVVKGMGYLEFKGVIEALLDEMGIKDTQFSILSHGDRILSLELSFEELVGKASKFKVYSPLSKFTAIKEDITFKVSPSWVYSQIEQKIKSVDPRIRSVKFLTLFEDNLTLSLEFLDSERQISSEDVAPIREKVARALKLD